MGFCTPRDLAAFIYALAAELEQRSKRIGANWVISPYPFNSRLDIEMSERDEPGTGLLFVEETLTDLGLDTLVSR